MDSAVKIGGRKRRDHIGVRGRGSGCPLGNGRASAEEDVSPAGPRSRNRQRDLHEPFPPSFPGIELTLGFESDVSPSFDSVRVLSDRADDEEEEVAVGRRDDAFLRPTARCNPTVALRYHNVHARLDGDIWNIVGGPGGRVSHGGRRGKKERHGGQAQCGTPHPNSPLLRALWYCCSLELPPFGRVPLHSR